MATFDRRGTVAIGRPLPIRSGGTVSAVVVSGSRTVTTAATRVRSGTITAVNQPSGSRLVIPLGTTRTRTGTVAVGRVPTDRTGSTTVATAVSGSRVVGALSGVFYDRTGLIVTGRVAKLRTGATASKTRLSATRDVVPRGTIDRSGGGAGGAGQSTPGLLLTLQAHPGATLSASWRLGTTLPARTGTVAGKTRLSGGRNTQRDRTGAVIVPVVVIGNRVSTGNRNRNGLTLVTNQPAGSVALTRQPTRTGATITSIVLSGARETGVIPIYLRTGLTLTSVQLTGTRTVRTGLLERASTTHGRTVLTGRVRVTQRGATTYVFTPLTTGRVADAAQEGVVLA